MNGQAMTWMPAILALFGSLIVMLFTAWLNTRAVIAHVDALRAEMRGEMSTLRAEVKRDIAELELRLTKQISELSHRVERLEELGGRVVRP